MMSYQGIKLTFFGPLRVAGKFTNTSSTIRPTKEARSIRISPG